MNYSKEQQDLIMKGKTYLKAIREIKRERMNLLEEYNVDPSPSSIVFQETKGTSLSQVTRMNDYALKRDILLKRIKLFNQVIDDFCLKSFFLPTRQRQILQVYMDAKSYMEMLDELNEQYYISASTYKRELPEICLSLAPYFDFNHIPSLSEINDKFYKECYSTIRH